MPQVTGSMSWANAKVEYSVNGTVWNDISGAENSVKVDGGARQVGEAYTNLGDTAIITQGKREPVDVEVNVLYTDSLSEPFELFRALYEAGTLVAVRWSPKGGSTGQRQYATDLCPISEFAYPQGEAGSADPLMTAFKLHSPKVTDAAAL